MVHCVTNYCGKIIRPESDSWIYMMEKARGNIKWHTLAQLAYIDVMRVINYGYAAT